MKPGNYTATGKLLWSYLRSGEILTILLILLPLLFAYAAAASNLMVLQTPEQLATYIAENQGNAMLGLIAANTIAAATIWRIRLSTAIIISIFSIILVINNTRKDEDQGRLELLRAGAVGRKAPLTAVLIKVFVANLLGGLAMAVGFMAAGFPAPGSLVAGLATALCGCAFAAIAAIGAQLAPNVRLARGLSFGAVAIFFVGQMVANVMENQILLLFIPFGWCAAARPYAGENYLVFEFAVIAITALTLIADQLNDRRDLGGSYFRERRGRLAAQKSFNNPLALAWRQQRGMLAVWVVAYLIMGLIIASLVPSINKMLAGTTFLPELSALLGGAGNAFLAILEYILTQVITAYAIITILRIREEETMNRTEMILSNPVSRIRYAGGHLVIAFAGSALAISIFGWCIGDFTGSIARIPAVWLVAAVTVLLLGLAPRAAAPVSWGIFGALLLLEFLWEIRLVGNLVFALSPFAWVYPGVGVSIVPVVIMLLAAMLLVALGLVFFNRRDIIGD